MTLGAYIWGIWFMAGLSLAATAGVIFYVDPEKAGGLGLALFYFLVFLALGSFFNLILIFLRRKILGTEIAAESVGLSFRQGMLIALMIIGILILQNSRVLFWWDAMLVVAGVFLIELYFLSKN